MLLPANPVDRNLAAPEEGAAEEEADAVRLLEDTALATVGRISAERLPTGVLLTADMGSGLTLPRGTAGVFAPCVPPTLAVLPPYCPGDVPWKWSAEEGEAWDGWPDAAVNRRYMSWYMSRTASGERVEGWG